MMMAFVISRAACDFEFSGACGDGVAGGLKHIPMAMRHITCRCQQPLSMLLSIMCVEPGSWVQRSAGRTKKNNNQPRTERSDDDAHLATTINSRATTVNVLLDHVH
jgi:hypothetical protein